MDSRDPNLHTQHVSFLVIMDVSFLINGERSEKEALLRSFGIWVLLVFWQASYKTVSQKRRG